MFSLLGMLCTTVAILFEKCYALLLQLEELLKLSSPFVKRLIIRQLLPPPHDQLLADDDEGDG